MTLPHRSVPLVHGSVESLCALGDKRAWGPDPCTAFPRLSTCRTKALRSQNLGDMHFSTAPTTTERYIERDQKQRGGGQREVPV